MKTTIIYTCLLCTFLFAWIPLFSQSSDPDSIHVSRGIIKGNDTILIMELEEVRICKRSDFEYLSYKRRDRRLVRNVKRAYPYAKIAGIELKELDERLARLKSEDEQKEYIDRAEKQIMNKFEKDVKKLTITQGIILVKLIDRETGHTSYEVIKDLKGGFTAFFWQGIARIFGNNLKAEYDPGGVDAKIEDIVRGIEAGYI
ncbi:MAG: DUF4294 domain-containing protein [Bacteroidetes bacterium]|nr:DUF4294 domain-containing protein [Bacteroidota bacterium]